MIFIDTGAFLGRYLPRDQHHSEAQKGWKRLEEAAVFIYTSNFILDEVFTLLARRASYAFASETAQIIYASNAFTILRPTEEHERGAIELFSKYADQKVSFTDCISFTLMKHHRLKKVFTFDAHFERAGFVIWG